MKPILIGIAGGTGAGKSTVTAALQNKYPDDIQVIEFDGYFRKDPPKLEGYDNFDHPDAIYFDRLVSDLKSLSEGNVTSIPVKAELVGPGEYAFKERDNRDLLPTKIIIVEGYLALYHPEVRKLFKESIFLDIDHAVRWERRVHFKFGDYETKVAIPMHEKYVEPTKEFADKVIDVSGKSRELVFTEVEKIILAYI
ncbi:MAG TPA: uridine kinase [Patescibacteria group bacterium]|nr:uridine kinase [Patescibacteria group bacterium]